MEEQANINNYNSTLEITKIITEVQRNSLKKIEGSFLYTDKQSSEQPLNIANLYFKNKEERGGIFYSQDVR